MAKIFLPLTYAPKIQGVIDGSIRQTIRGGWKRCAGDMIAFHGWEGKPYRSKWSFRTEYHELIDVIDIYILRDSVLFMAETGNPAGDINIVYWEEMNTIAALDGIDPPTGEALQQVLDSMGLCGGPAQILRW